MATGYAANPALPPLTAATIKVAREQLETILGKRRTDRDARIDELTDEIMELFWMRKKKREQENDGKIESVDDWPLFETVNGQLDPLEERIYELVTILSEVLKRNHPDKYGTSLDFKRKMARDFMKEFEFWLMNDAVEEGEKWKKLEGKRKGKEKDESREVAEETKMRSKMEKVARKMKERKWNYS